CSRRSPLDAWFASVLRTLRSPNRLSRTVSGRGLLCVPPWSGVVLRPRGPRSEPGYILSRSIHAYWPHPTHSQAHHDFADCATYTRCLRCAGAPRRPTSGSELSLHILSWHAVPYVPGEIGI